MSTETMTTERRHTFDSQPHLSIDLSSQKRHSTGIDWFFESTNRATKRRFQNVCPLTPVAEDIKSTPSTSYFEHVPQANDNKGKQRAQSDTPMGTISESDDFRPRSQSYNMSDLSRVDSASSTESQRKRRASWTRRLSWVPGWTFAGSSAEEGLISEERTPLASNERRASRFGSIGENVSRRWSSFSQGISEFHAAVNEPSHEKNFPAPIQFPETGGMKTTVPVYGTVDALSQIGMRVLSPCGAKSVSFTDKEDMNEELLAQHFCSKLKDGDMLCEDPKLGEGNKLAVVLRGDMQEFTFKCSVVGLFPMKLIGSEKELPEPYLMDVLMY